MDAITVLFSSHRLLMIIFLTIALHLTAFARDQKCAGVFSNLVSQKGISSENDVTSIRVSRRNEKGLRRIKENNFNTERTLQEYRNDFGGKLFGILKTLNHRDHSWIDMGAGSANAQIRFLKVRLNTSALEVMPQLRPVSYVIPERSLNRIRKIENQFPEVFQYTEGFQTPATIRKMKPADLITDDVGIVQYADSLGLKKIELVEAYLDILKPGGYLLISPFTRELLSMLPEKYFRELEIADIFSSEDISPFLLIKKKL